MTTALAKRAWQLHCAAASLVLPPLLQFVSFERLAARIAAVRPTGPAPSPDDASLAWWVDSALRPLPPPWRHTCLRRALVLYYLMRRAGRPVTLSIGVRRGPTGGFEAHAWLVREGRPYLEPAASVPDDFHVIASFPERLAAGR